MSVARSLGGLRTPAVNLTRAAQPYPGSHPVSRCACTVHCLPPPQQVVLLLHCSRTPTDCLTTTRRDSYCPFSTTFNSSCFYFRHLSHPQPPFCSVRATHSSAAVSLVGTRHVPAGWCPINISWAGKPNQTNKPGSCLKYLLADTLQLRSANACAVDDLEKVQILAAPSKSRVSSPQMVRDPQLRHADRHVQCPSSVP